MIHWLTHVWTKPLGAWTLLDLFGLAVLCGLRVLRRSRRDDRGRSWETGSLVSRRSGAMWR
jgi:hypothetical protein